MLRTPLKTGKISAKFAAMPDLYGHMGFTQEVYTDLTDDKGMDIIP